MIHKRIMKSLDALKTNDPGRYAAEDVLRATGIPEPSQRLLQKLGIVTPERPKFRTSKRTFNLDAVKLMACIKPLADGGLSLTVSGKIIHAFPGLENFLFEATDLNVFQPDQPTRTEDTDPWIEVLDQRFVRTAWHNEGPHIVGELSSDKQDFIVWHGSVFASWFGTPADPLFDPGGERVIRESAPAFRFYNTKKPTEADLRTAEYSWRNPTSRISVNVGMAVRNAMRRLFFTGIAAEG
jgi:hypothetical protein